MTSEGPSPARIIAAAGSVSAGIGLVALLAGTATPSEVVVHVEPAPVIVAPTPTASGPGTSAGPIAPDPETAIPVQAATPAPTASPPTTVPPARVVTTSEGS